MNFICDRYVTVEHFFFMLLNIFAAAFFFIIIRSNCLFPTLFGRLQIAMCVCVCESFFLSLARLLLKCFLNAIVMYRNRLIVIFYKCSNMSLLCYCTRCYTVDLTNLFCNPQSKRQRMLLFFHIEHPSYSN